MELAYLCDRGIIDQAVLRAMGRVPREQFVLEQDVLYAYDDHPLPIGFGQTISQPYMVAVMTQLLRLQPKDRVLEIGTGSGYQTAILAEIASEVYSIERLPSLYEQARGRLSLLGYDKVKLRCADGYSGWSEQAPFDGIIVTCAPEQIPPPLTAQLTQGGRMVIPVGPPSQHQMLWLVERLGDQIRSTPMMGVVFVPLVSTCSPDED